MRQEIADEAALARYEHDVAVRFVDLHTGAAFACHTGIGVPTGEHDAQGRVRSRFPRHLRAELRAERAEAASGNPVRCA